MNAAHTVTPKSSREFGGATQFTPRASSAAHVFWNSSSGTINARWGNPIRSAIFSITERWICAFPCCSHAPGNPPKSGRGIGSNPKVLQ
jgi:hypothetical protein